MANYSTLKAAVADVVKTNGTQAITGANLQAVLLSIINSVGGGGYIFKGVATPSTDAGTPDENVFYIGGAGTYANFGTSVTVPAGSICVFKYNGSWTKEQISFVDADSVAYGRKTFAKELAVSDSTQAIALHENNYGKVIEIRIKSLTATVPNVSLGVRTNGASTYYTLSTSWLKITKSTDIDRLYIFANSCSVAGTAEVEVIWGDLERLYFPDMQPVLNSDNLITSAPVAQLQLETIGIIEQTWYQGTINGTTGKYSSTSIRVTNATAINSIGNIRVICKGDVRGDSLKLYKDGKSPVDGGSLNTDFITYTLPSTSSRTDFVIERDTTYPNVYITFVRNSDSSANITTSEVSSNVQIFDTSSMFSKLVNNGSFKGVAQTNTIPDTTNAEAYYLAKQSGTYTNFGNIVVNSGEYCILSYKNSTWSKTVIAQEEFSILGKGDAISTLCGFINYETGELTTRDADFFLKIYDAHGIVDIKSYTGAGATTTAQIAFYSSNEISTSSYLGAYSVQSIYDANGSGRWYSTDNIPSEAVIAVVYDRFGNVAESDAIVQVKYRYVSMLPSILEKLETTIYGVQLNDLNLVQGGYSAEGVPSGASSRVRVNRMIAKSEAPFTIYVPSSDNGRLYLMHTYSVLDDYGTDTGQVYLYVTNPQEITITQDMIGNNAGVTFSFCAKNDITSQITPSDFSGTKFIVANGLEDDVVQLKDRVDNIASVTKNEGNSDYYGRIVTLNITDERHKLTSRLVCEHYNDEYPYTTKNQSLAVWDGKAFCFNDTSFAGTDGFCVVIDVETGNVLSRVMDIPPVIDTPNYSHLNGATFTNQYYQYGDKYPLLLLSRGDYVGSTTTKLCMYVFRITEPTTNNFVFTKIKTINVPSALNNPTWGYDASRRMIWGHYYSQDFRWQYGGRLFDNSSLPVCAPTGTEYICITSGGATAATSATITLTVGTVEREINVSAGGTFEEIFAYIPYQSGISYIKANQSAEAFTGKYEVFTCDANGNNRELLQYECIIQGFDAPNLKDGADVTIPQSDMTIPVFIDTCIWQGCSFANGKFLIPIQNYTTINRQPTNYTGHVCAVIEPTTGYIESIIKTDSLENQGCAVWNGKLYVSSHSGNATGHTIGFKLFEYTFD